MILYQTTEFTTKDYFECGDMPKGSYPLFTWAVGGQKRLLPDNVGFRIGKSAGIYAALQIHYDNPNLWSSRTDSSGVILTLTSQLRPMDASYFVVAASTSSIQIPPGKPYFELTSYCDTGAWLQRSGVTDLLEEYTILKSGPHMHLLGRQFYTEHFRPDAGTGDLVNLGNAGCDDFYSFNDQRSQTIGKDSTIRPGDVFVNHCIYDSTSKTTVTKGCESTDCEMCLNFMIYYPKIPSLDFFVCGSLPAISQNNVSKLHCA